MTQIDQDAVARAKAAWAAELAKVSAYQKQLDRRLLANKKRKPRPETGEVDTIDPRD